MILTFIFGTLGLTLGIVALTLVLLKALGYLGGDGGVVGVVRPRPGRIRRFVFLIVGLASLLTVGVLGVEYIWSNTASVTVRPNPVYTLTITQNNTELYEGDIVRFTGQLTVDGSPLASEPVNIYYNTTGFVATVFTNTTGHYTLDWTAPPVTGETTYDFQARYEKP